MKDLKDMKPVDFPHEVSNRRSKSRSEALLHVLQGLHGWSIWPGLCRPSSPTCTCERWRHAGHEHRLTMKDLKTMKPVDCPDCVRNRGSPCRR